MYDYEKMKMMGGDFNYSYEVCFFYLRVGLCLLFYILNFFCSMDGIILISYFIER